MTTITAPAISRKTAQTMLFMVVFSLLCHWVIVPIAAWNHSLLLVIVSALAPMVLVNLLRRLGKYPAYKNETRSHVKSLVWLVVKTAIGAFFFWNHLWIIAIVAIFVMSISKNKNKANQ
jgi:hypothetical protein